MPTNRSTAGLRVAAVLCDEAVPRFEDSYPEDELAGLARKGKVDLAVFPEASLGYQYDQTQPSVYPLKNLMEYSRLIGVPVLAGAMLGDFTDDEPRELFQTALFANPWAEGRDTGTHCYVKHSSVSKKAFDWPGYAGPEDPMYQPIALTENRIGCLVCHDMYYGPLCHNQAKRGASMFIDLTGGAVNEAKWRTIAATRSIDYGCPFLVTMNLRPGKGVSIAFAYRDGRELEPHEVIIGKHGRIAIFDLGGEGGKLYSPPSASETDGVRFKRVIELSIGTDGRADFNPFTLRLADGRQSTPGAWATINKGHESLAILPIRAEDLLDPMYVYRHMPPKGIRHHILVVMPDSARSVDPALLRLLARGRAIEHLVAVLYKHGEGWGCEKVTRYKQPQHVPQRIEGGVAHFRLDASGGLAGPWSAGGKHPYRGIGSFRNWQSIVEMGAAG